MITSGRNLGRVGTIVSRERHAGSFDIVHVKDAVGHTFATRYVTESCSQIPHVLINYSYFNGLKMGPLCTSGLLSA